MTELANMLRIVDDSHIVVNAKDVYDGTFRDIGLNVNYFKPIHKKSGWINIYPAHSDTKVGLTSVVVYATEEEAKISALKKCTATVEINWEE